MGTCQSAGLCRKDIHEDMDAENGDVFKRMLLISSNLDFPEVLIQAAKQSVTVIPVQYASWTPKDLDDEIQKRAGTPAGQFASIGIMDHGRAGQFCFLQSVGDGDFDLQELKEHEEYRAIFQNLVRYLAPPADPQNWKNDVHRRIDLLTCDTAQGEEGAALIEYLESITQVNWTASTDKTGNEQDGHNFVMETDMAVGDIKGHYFYEEPLKKWHSCCSDDEREKLEAQKNMFRSEAVDVFTTAIFGEASSSSWYDSVSHVSRYVLRKQKISKTGVARHLPIERGG
eukprot:TRINITY_DN2016_c0_g1_i2.p2 TRINITY_DN2016_c0_g1~~TRINITY_DN2016_c0_g1_i2.p2  ORF type:complete len:285 (+),score=35.98 TRINITY_DN2016_c0_g1_i2:83-937(+)